MVENNDALLYGKSDIRRIVGIEVQDSSLELFIQNEDGSIQVEHKPHRYWILTNEKAVKGSVRLEGDLHYKWGIQYDTREAFQKARSYLKHKYDIYSIWNPEEAAMIKDGYTFYRDMKPTDVSLLSFDIETTGVDPHASDAKVLLISTTYRNHLGVTTNKLFSYDEYENEGAFINAFCDYVREMDPSLIVGHNIISFDFFYLNERAKYADTHLYLGRDDSACVFNTYESKFRLDGSRDLLYKNVSIYGREVVDTFLLAISFDVSKSFESYALKMLIKQLGFEKEGRQHYDAGSIRHHYKIRAEWEKIKAYAIDDSEDSVKLWDYFGPTYFYSCQNIPKPLSEILLSATGAKVNSILLRAYLQDRHSIPKTSEIKGGLEGGISFGVPGIYRNTKKSDIRSCYPSQVLRFKIHDKEKDPKMYFYIIVKHFTEQRFYYKKMYKETGLQEWKDQDNVAKLFINSAYGTLSTPGLAFNSPENAALITRESRKVIDIALKWASGKGVEQWMKEYGNKEFEKEGDVDA